MKRGMNVLFHGRPYCTSLSPLPLYHGRHDVRTLGIEGDVDYRYDPVHDTFESLFHFPLDSEARGRLAEMLEQEGFQEEARGLRLETSHIPDMEMAPAMQS